jgi:hypothetical protein
MVDQKLSLPVLVRGVRAALPSLPPGLVALILLVQGALIAVPLRYLPLQANSQDDLLAQIQALAPLAFPYSVMAPFASAMLFVALRCAWSGVPVTLKSVLADAVRLWPFAFLLSFGLELLYGVGLQLLVFPALILAGLAMAMLPALVIERLNPIDAIRRGWELGDGARLQMVGVASACLALLVLGTMLGATLATPILSSSVVLVKWLGAWLLGSWLAGLVLITDLIQGLVYLHLASKAPRRG